MSLDLPDTFLFEKRGRIALMTINRPEALNAFTREMLIGMDRAFEAFEADPDLWVAVLTANGDRAFSTGMDLKNAIPALIEGDTMGYADPAKRPFQNVFKPIVAAVNGMCIAGGLEFLLGTDLRIAAEHARFGLTEVRWGIVPAGGSHVRLPQQVPWAVAMELLLTGNQITAERAYQVGLVNRVVPAAKLLEEALELAQRLCENGPLAMRVAKEIAVRALDNEPAFVLEKRLAERVLRSEDAREGPRAFLEKRKPNYNGR